MHVTLQNIQPNAVMDQANWCFRTMRNCTDAQLTAELSYMGSTLLNKARKESQPAETVTNALRRVCPRLSLAERNSKRHRSVAAVIASDRGRRR